MKLRLNKIHPRAAAKINCSSSDQPHVFCSFGNVTTNPAARASRTNVHGCHSTHIGNPPSDSPLVYRILSVQSSKSRVKLGTPVRRDASVSCACFSYRCEDRVCLKPHSQSQFHRRSIIHLHCIPV